MKTLFMECNMGAAGDMLMGALFELLPESGQRTFLDRSEEHTSELQSQR